MVVCSITSRMPLFARPSPTRAWWVLAAMWLAGCGTAPDAEYAAAPGQIEEAAASGEAGGDAAGKTAQAAASPSQGAPGRVLERSFDDVKFEMEQGDPFTPSLLPADVASLDGQRIRIRGYILPSFQQEGITQFVLVRDNMECCFGPGAALYDCIVVRMVPGTSTNFSVRPVAVSGTFHVEELIGPDGRHLAIYSMDGEAVE